MNVHSPSELVRGLRLSDAISIVVGSVIGTGIFLKTAPMLQEVGTPWLVLLAWLVAGLLSLAGAFTYAELGSLFPQTGGEFVYLHQAYGKVPAFLYGWARFGIAAPASIAAYAAGSATFLADGLQLSQPGFRQLFALGVILIFTLFNVARVQVGGRIQTFLTGLKI
ncbi:MAG: amino acid permease, partial [Bdellovibrionales bacterium]|nr:amino acid permease [Bdellovibrionales bacterium]